MNFTDITSHEIACKILNRDPNAMPDVSMRPENQQKSIIAQIKLDDIGEAINQVTEFKADYKDIDQRKWFPVFDGSEGFAFDYSALR